MQKHALAVTAGPDIGIKECKKKKLIHLRLPR